MTENNTQKELVVHNHSMMKKFLNMLTEGLNGSRIEVVRDRVTGTPVVALTMQDPTQAQQMAMVIRCLSSLGELPAGVQFQTPQMTCPEISVQGTNTYYEHVLNRVSPMKNNETSPCGCKQEAMR